jgi:hypothetical protein
MEGITMKKIANSTKKFVIENRAALMGIVTGIAVTSAIISRIALSQHEDFLKEHDLYEEFYNLNEE